jgi:hypothetical protein
VILIGAALVGGIVLLAVGGEDDDGGSDRPTSPQVQRLQDELLDKTVVDPGAGISVRRPAAWSDSTRDRVITLLSKSRCVSMTLAAPVGVAQAKKLLAESKTQLRDAYPGIRFRASGHRPIGGIPTASYTASLKKEGKEVRVLVSVGSGTKNAYVTEVVLGNPSCRDDLTTAQVILTSIDYTK